MKNENEQFDELIRGKLESRQFAMPEDAWARAEKMIAARRRRGWFFSGLAGIAIIAILAFWLGLFSPADHHPDADHKLAQQNSSDNRHASGTDQPSINSGASASENNAANNNDNNSASGNNNPNSSNNNSGSSPSTGANSSSQNAAAANTNASAVNQAGQGQNNSTANSPAGSRNKPGTTAAKTAAGNNHKQSGKKSGTGNSSVSPGTGNNTAATGNNSGAGKPKNPRSGKNENENTAVNANGNTDPLNISINHGSASTNLDSKVHAGNHSTPENPGSGDANATGNAVAGNNSVNNASDSRNKTDNKNETNDTNLHPGDLAVNAGASENAKDNQEKTSITTSEELSAAIELTAPDGKKKKPAGSGNSSSDNFYADPGTGKWFADAGLIYNTGFSSLDKTGQGFSPLIGAGYTLSLSKRFSVSASAQYCSIGHASDISRYFSSTTYGFGSEASVTEIGLRKLHYAQVPLMLNLALGKNNMISLGATAGFLLASQSEVRTYTITGTTIQNEKTSSVFGYDNGLKHFDILPVISCSRFIRENWAIQLRYQIGLTDIKDNTIYNAARFERSSCASFMLRYHF